MIDVECTKEEKRELAVIYGFLVDVWTQQQAGLKSAMPPTRRTGQECRDNATQPGNRK